MQAHEVVATTIAEYDRMAAEYRRGTADHDVSQNIAALLEAIEGEAPYVILDLGCGPGRDLRQFTALGHEAVGLAPFPRLGRTLCHGARQHGL